MKVTIKYQRYSKCKLDDIWAKPSIWKRKVNDNPSQQLSKFESFKHNVY